jgi:hypothetical protein
MSDQEMNNESVNLNEEVNDVDDRPVENVFEEPEIAVCRIDPPIAICNFQPVNEPEKDESCSKEK